MSVGSIERAHRATKEQAGSLSARCGIAGVGPRWKTRRVEYDPTQFSGTARYYLRGRPPYSAQLYEVLKRELALDGTGRLLDIGSGPGTLGVQLAGLFEHLTLLEPDDRAAR
jgi:hypothetical protein